VLFPPNLKICLWAWVHARDLPECERFREVAHFEVEEVVAFAFKGQDRVRAKPHVAVHPGSEVNPQEGKTRVRNLETQGPKVMLTCSIRSAVYFLPCVFANHLMQQILFFTCTVLILQHKNLGLQISVPQIVVVCSDLIGNRTVDFCTVFTSNLK